ncbi:hypothetical protein [Streptomyces sp. UH6]|uniref:hypothetical protein n=1 Tax=Streptomyces sp. UH6 TaxID=2748379 RepID=UPI0015D4CB21|nr:hypothetical protein [Streptomyces sp. UH6]NYV73842.1 hypothetical protein [Streptomyces sp. UH6]
MHAQASSEAEYAQARSRRGTRRGGAPAGGASVSEAMLALQRTAGNAAVTAMVQRSRHEHGDGCGPTGCGGSGVVQRAKAKDWKLGSTSTELAAVKAGHPGDPLVDTLHHIIPKSLFQPFLALLSPSQVLQITTDLAPLAPAAFASPNTDKALKNLPANFRIGPRPEDRSDDPGSGLDVNTTASGNTTPRSEQLENVYHYMEAAITAGAVTQTDFDTLFLAPMIDACTQHGTAINIDPARATWVTDPATGKYHKP